MADSGTLHGRNARLYLGATNASPIPKFANATGTAISKFEIQTGVDFAEDTAQGDPYKTYVPGLPDYSGSLDFFFQDANTSHLQYSLIDAAMQGTALKHYAYPGIAAGMTTVYFYGLIYLSLKSLPLDVGALVTASFEFKAGGAITFKHA